MLQIIIIRDCIRKYNPENTTAQHEKGFGGSGVKKEVLVSTLDYLGMKPPSNVNKGPLATMLLRRIQNLLPDVCVFCHEEYTVGPNDTPILICRLYNQGSHDECLKAHIKDTTGQDIGDDVTDSQAIINPSNIPGVHYICHVCEHTKLPEPLPLPGSGRNPNANQVDVDPTQADENDDTRGAHGGDDDEEDEDRGTDGDEKHTTHKAGEKQSDAADLKKSLRKNNTPDKDPNGDPPRLQNVCPHYAKKKCRYEVSGKGCSKNTPVHAVNLCDMGRNPKGIQTAARDFPLVQSGILYYVARLSRTKNVRIIKTVNSGISNARVEVKTIR